MTIYTKHFKRCNLNLITNLMQEKQQETNPMFGATNKTLTVIKQIKQKYSS